jgi:hypothetical protein
MSLQKLLSITDKPFKINYETYIIMHNNNTDFILCKKNEYYSSIDLKGTSLEFFTFFLYKKVKCRISISTIQNKITDYQKNINSY